MPEKQDIAEAAIKITNQAVAQLAKEGKDPEAKITITQRDLAHIASLSTAYTMTSMKEKLEALQDIIKEYVLNEIASELKAIDRYDKKIAMLDQRLTMAYKILDEHHDRIHILEEDVEDEDNE